ncbi:XAC2610-related protein [Flavitalea flava]
MRITIGSAIISLFFHAVSASSILPKLSGHPGIMTHMRTNLTLLNNLCAKPPEKKERYEKRNETMGLKPLNDSDTIIKIKAQKLLRHLHEINKYPMGGHDTLIDLNGDHFKDILIEFYSLAGTGEKNCINVFLYDKVERKFIENKQLNHLCNPTFYFKKK